MRNIFITFRSCHLFEFQDDETINISFLKTQLSNKENIPCEKFRLEIEHKEINETNYSLFSNTFDSLFISAVLINGINGGKGGFGAALRRAAKQSGPKKTVDFGACRDLSGRRIRHVNDEIILRKWQEAKDRGEEFNVDEETQSGIKLWFLPTPSWTEGFGKKPKNSKRKAKRKTDLCKDWARAHETGRFIPPNAPTWWGCPRGHRCDFAHGEDDMDKDVRTSVQEKRKQDGLQSKRDALNNYLDPIYDDANEGEDLVMAGLKRVSKRARATTATQTTTDNDVTHEAIASHGQEIDDQIKQGNATEDMESIELMEPVVSSPPTSTSQCSWLSLLTGDALVLPSGEVRGQEEFSTVQASDSALYDFGSWYYELELLTGGLMQVGWACTGFEPSALGGNGVGDHPRSWAYDGFRVLRWNVNPVQYGEFDSDVSKLVEGQQISQDQAKQKMAVVGDTEEADEVNDPLLLLQQHQWHAGDIIGCSLQVSEHSGHVLVRMVFSRNGVSLGDAFYFDLKESLAIGKSDASATANTHANSIGFFPALSVDSNQAARVNLGHEPFKYTSPFPGAQSVYSSSSSSSSTTTTSNVNEKAHNLDSSIPVRTMNEVGNQIQDGQFKEIPIESSEYSSWAALIPLGSDNLKNELTRRGLKCGGTVEERAKRLFSIRGLSNDEINVKLKVRPASADMN